MSAIQGAAIAQDLPKGQKATPATQADIITYKNMGSSISRQPKRWKFLLQ
jgi:hypothetical protein